MEIAHYTLVFAIANFVSFSGTVNGDMRWGAIGLFVLFWALVGVDGYLSLNKVLARTEGEANPIIVLSPSITLAAIAFIGGCVGIFTGLTGVS